MSTTGAPVVAMPFPTHRSPVFCSADIPVDADRLAARVAFSAGSNVDRSRSMLRRDARYGLIPEGLANAGSDRQQGSTRVQPSDKFLLSGLKKIRFEIIGRPSVQSAE